MKGWLRTGLTAALIAVPSSFAGGSDAERVCRLLSAHVPRADVAHVPGADTVRGRAVPPADLRPVRIAVPRQFFIDLRLPLADLLPRRAGDRLADAKVDIGRVDVDLGTGRLRYNDQPLAPAVQDRVYARCRALAE